MQKFNHVTLIEYSEGKEGNGFKLVSAELQNLPTLDMWFSKTEQFCSVMLMDYY